MNPYYFYVLARDFGLCFIKFSAYVPFTARVWVNGHEWAKRQLEHEGSGDEAGTRPVVADGYARIDKVVKEARLARLAA